MYERDIRTNSTKAGSRLEKLNKLLQEVQAEGKGDYIAVEPETLKALLTTADNAVQEFGEVCVCDYYKAVKYLNS